MKAWLNSNKYVIIYLIFLTVALTGFINISRTGGQATILAQETSSQKAAVLTFHAVSAGLEANPAVISQNELEKTFQLMLQNGYHPINLAQFHGFLDGGKSGVPEKAVLVTFDDGYEDNFLLAYPTAQKYRIPAVVFPVTKWFADYPRPEPHRPHLSLAQAQTIISEGLWSLGSHGYDGHRVVPGDPGTGFFYTTPVVQPGSNETEPEYKARIWNDVLLSTYTLERLVGIRPVDFAFPYGSSGEIAKEILARAGYRYLYTNEPGLNRPGQDPSRILRITAAKTAGQNLALLDAYFARE